MKKNMFSIEFTLPGADKASRIYVGSIRQRDLVLEMLNRKKVYAVHVCQYKRASCISHSYYNGKRCFEFHHKNTGKVYWEFDVLRRVFPPAIYAAA